MKTAKLVLKKPVGFQPGAKLFQLSVSTDYRTQAISITATNAKAEIQQTKFVVLSPGKLNNAKLFPANKDGFCISWFAVAEFTGTPDFAAALDKIGYKLVS